MSYHVLGVERKQGEYEGRGYDNTYLHCAYENKNVNGLAVATVKVKTDVLDPTINYLDKDVTVYYNSYGKAELVQVEK